jgi:beta-glucosidase
MGLKAGVDTDCGSYYQAFALDALKEGLITEADMDLALVNMFTIRMRIGEFDPKNDVPYAYIQPDVVNAPGHVSLAVEVATKTPVLLKNNVTAKTGRNTLPVKADAIKKIAIIGPQADRVELGPYSGRPDQKNMVSLLAGVKNYMSEKGLSAEVLYSAGASTSNRNNLFFVLDYEVVKSDGSVTKHDATKFTSSSEGIVIGSGMSDENSVRNIQDGDWTAYTGVDLTDLDKMNIRLNIPADGGTVEARIGSPTGNLLATFEALGGVGGMRGGPFGGARTVAGKINKLGLTGPQTLYLVYRASALAPIDKETIEMAASADVAVVFTGTDDQTAGEEGDRLTLVLPGNQYELIDAVAAVNPNTIVIMQTLGMVEVEQFRDNPNVAGIIWTGFNGQSQGTAMAKILFGDVNPGGKLNATWYKSVNDLPEITDYTLRGGANKNGRTYWYFDKDVSYEFGYGLSYTAFEYSNFEISQTAITPNDKITVSVDVKNTGEVDGDEIVQVYLKTPDSPASLQRPIKRLKGFQRVSIAAGQTKRVSIDIDCSDLWFWDPDNDRITFDQGRYVFEIGASSKDIRGEVEANMSGTYKPTLKTAVAECGKVVLKPGDSVQTSVTAAISDDSLYDITNVTVEYSSNDPAVASVDEKGLVTVKGAGVTSITATVTVEGKTVSDSYPLKVLPDLTLSSLEVNGGKIAGFNPDVHGYSYLLPAGSSEVPQVSATANSADVTVETEQAESVPGTALITLSDKTIPETDEYVVNFGFESVSDEFENTAPGEQWSWVREDKTNWSLTESPGYLVITSQEGDIQGSSNDARNILIQDANTDWIIESKIEFSGRPVKADQQGGLIAYQDDDNYVKLVYDNARKGFMGSDVFIELLVENHGSQYSAANVRTLGLLQYNYTIVFKLEKKGSNYFAYYSMGGESFELLGSTDVILTDVKAGLIVCDGADIGGGNDLISQMLGQMGTGEVPEFKIKCDYFRIENTGIE